MAVSVLTDVRKMDLHSEKMSWSGESDVQI
jgi:hypothetical protein